MPGIDSMMAACGWAWKASRICRSSCLSRSRSVRHPDAVATTALTAAQAQRITLPGQGTAASITADLAQQVLALDESSATAPTAPTISRNEPRATNTSPPSSPSPADASTSCGPSSATTALSPPRHHRRPRQTQRPDPG